MDAFQVMMDGVGGDEKALPKYLSDGLHLTAEGYSVRVLLFLCHAYRKISSFRFRHEQVVYKELITTIQNELPELHYNKLPTIFPQYVHRSEPFLADKCQIGLTVSSAGGGTSVVRIPHQFNIAETDRQLTDVNALVKQC